ncbi:MAG: hypothetical protein AB9856_03810 [Cellulosilyticaceae bacterium]
MFIKKGFKIMYVELGCDGFVYQCDGTYCIVINNQLSPDQKSMLKNREMGKIRRGVLKGSYLIFL